jgi:predicted O-linked N-acetylglucosamine transferase (SPINDLY family)
VAKLTIDQAIQKAINAHKAGRSQEAYRLYAAILKVQPKHPDANHNTGLLTVGFGKIELALPFFKTALEANPSNAQFWYSHIVALIKLARLMDAKVLLDQAKLKGIKGADFDLLEQKLNYANKDLSIKLDQADTYFNIGIALQQQNKLEEAVEAYKKALSIKPDYANAYYNMGIALKKQNKLEEAVEAYKKALSIKPDYANAHNNIGIAHKDQGNLEEAVEAYKKALSIKPDYANAYCNMGNTLKEQSKFEEAVEAYRKAIVINPDNADFYNNMGIAHQDQGDLEEAIEVYNKALTIKPDDAATYYNMGIVLKEQGKLEEAIKAYSKALTIKPDDAATHYNMGNTLKEQGKLEEAIKAYSKTLTIDPNHEAARVQRLHQQAHICDWGSIAAELKLVPELGTTGKGVSPFAFLSMEDAPERHRTRSKIYARTKYTRELKPEFVKPSQKPKRLKIGYFSADFHSFAGMYLMIGLLEKHDRAKFEISAFSYGPDINDQMRNRIVNAVDHFIDIKTADSNTVVNLVRQRNIDIAVHRNGYTKNERTELFASGLAPIQINYLGYPGTLGADFIDYIVADPVLIPEDKRQNYSEQIIYLPNTYQPTDNTRIISDKVIKRKSMGLPDKGFVFCCFNQIYKISPSEFDIWMRLLKSVKGSVLWLLESNKLAEQNLKRQAEAHGVSAKRIIFAEKVPQAEHLARQRLADLFLDTFNYNAHTTTSDALWAGLPLVTKLGKGFAARVAGSLLNAVGLPELVTKTEKDYEGLILELATNPTKLAKIKEKLKINRLTQPLFNTELYTKHLENGYQQAYQNYFEGNLPQTIIVPK